MSSLLLVVDLSYKYLHNAKLIHDFAYLKANVYLTDIDKHNIDLRFYFEALLLKQFCNTKLLELYKASCPQTNLF